MKTTQIIAGHSITLTIGRRYRACRPMAERKGQTFLVSFYDITDINEWNGSHSIAGSVGPLDYDAANNLLNAFNKTSEESPGFSRGEESRG